MEARRHGGIIDEAELPDVLEPLPVAALRVEAAVVTALADVGIERVGELLALGREAVADRFGEAVLLRIDQALGQAFEGVEPIRPWEALQVSRAFDGPVKQLTGIEQTVRELVAVLCEQLQQRESGVRRLVMTAERIDASDITESLTLSRPSRSARHLWRLLRPRVERLHLGYGVERVTLRAAATGRLVHRQEAAWGADGSREARAATAEREAKVAALVDQFVERLGPARVTRLEAVETYVPERAFVHRPWAEAVGKAGEARVVRSDRPTLLLGRAEEVEVVSLSPDGPVAAVRWRGLGGGGSQRRIVTSIGPERITPRWWLSEPGRTPLPRDYFKVQDEHGCWWWLYRKAGTRRWFVHGVWM